MSRTLFVVVLAFVLSLENALAQDRAVQARDSAQANPSAAHGLRPSLPPYLTTSSLLRPERGTPSPDSSVWALEPFIAPQFDYNCFAIDIATAVSIRLGCGDDSLCQRYMTGLYEDRHGEISVWADMTAWVLEILVDEWVGDTHLLAHSPSRWRLSDPP